LTVGFLPKSQIEFWISVLGTDLTHNAISLSSSGTQNVLLGEQFLFGSITFTNGVWFSDPEFTVRFTSSSPVAAFDDQVWFDTIHLSITPNSATNTAQENADFIYLKNLPALGSIRAYELEDSPTGGNTVTVDVYGSINSLDLERFANARGGGFLDPGIALSPTPSVVPEPATLALFGIALAGLAFRSRKRTA
jgi:hypothetical protein